MIGTILSWHKETRRGILQDDDGRRLQFSGDAVWPYDLLNLETAQRVCFELRGSRREVAINVRCWTPEPLVTALKASPAVGHLQYQGFAHRANLREYRFRRLVSGQAAEQFVVSVDLGLLAKHGVMLQEGPALCENSLAAILLGGSKVTLAGYRHVLTEDDLRNHCAKHKSAAILKPHRGGRKLPARTPTLSPAF